MGRTELSRVVDIDRRERIDVLYDQRGTQLVARHGNWNASAWDPDSHGEHSVEAKVHTLERYVDTGGIALVAFASGRLVGIGVVVPHLRPGIAQLAFLHVSAPFRATGIHQRSGGAVLWAASDGLMSPMWFPSGSEKMAYREPQNASNGSWVHV